MSAMPDNIESATVRHAKALYALLLEQAKLETIQIPLTDDEVECLVFRGRISALYEEVGASKAYYSKVRNFLTESGSIVTLERGNVHSLSVVVVDADKPPPDELPANVKSSESGLTIAQELGKLRRRVEALENSLGGLNITQAAANFEKRISRLENSSTSKDETGETERDTT